MKKCSHCELFKPLKEFHRDKSKPHGYKAQCKDCRTLAITQLYEKIINSSSLPPLHDPTYAERIALEIMKHHIDLVEFKYEYDFTDRKMVIAVLSYLKKWRSPP